MVSAGVGSTGGIRLNSALANRQILTQLVRDVFAALLPSAQLPVLIGGSMGTGSYVLAGTHASESLAFSSACHGAGRAMSRHQALKTWNGDAVVNAADAAGLARKVARLEPLLCVKG